MHEDVRHVEGADRLEQRLSPEVGVVEDELLDGGVVQQHLHLFGVAVPGRGRVLVDGGDVAEDDALDGAEHAA